MIRQQSVSAPRAGFAVGAIAGLLLGTGLGAVAGRINELSIGPPDPAHPEDNFVDDEETMMGMMYFWGPACAIFGGMGGAIGGVVGGAIGERKEATTEDCVIAIPFGCLAALAMLAAFRAVTGFPGGDAFRSGAMVWMAGSGLAAVAGTTFSVVQLQRGLGHSRQRGLGATLPSKLEILPQHFPILRVFVLAVILVLSLTLFLVMSR